MAVVRRVRQRLPDMPLPTLSTMTDDVLNRSGHARDVAAAARSRTHAERRAGTCTLQQHDPARRTRLHRPQVDGPHAMQKRRRSRPISRVLSWTVIPLGAASPQRSSSLPGRDTGRVIASLFGLAPSGVCHAGPLPDSRCALTAPFHPCRPACAVLGGIFLLHFPSARAAQALPGTLPCGARTFLDASEETSRLSGRLRQRAV